MKLFKSINSNYLKIIITVITGIFIVSLTGYLKDSIGYGAIALTCFIVMAMYGLVVLYFYFRPPIKIRIIKAQECNKSISIEPSDHGKPSIIFYIENFGDRNSLNPTINMTYICYKLYEKGIMSRIKSKNTIFKVKTKSVKDLNLPNEPKELTAICNERIYDRTIGALFLRYKFNFTGGGSKHLLLFSNTKDGNVGLLKFLFSLIKYAFSGSLNFLDKDPKD